MTEENSLKGTSIFILIFHFQSLSWSLKDALNLGLDIVTALAGIELIFSVET